MAEEKRILGILNPKDYPEDQQALVAEFNQKLLALSEENARLTMTVSKKDQEKQNQIVGTVRLYNINVTKDLIEDEIYDYSMGDGIPIFKTLNLPNPCPLNDFIEKTVALILKGSNQERFRNHFNRDRLLKAFEAGEYRQDLEYEMLLNPREAPHTFHHSILLTTEKDSGDVIAMCSARDITSLIQSQRQLNAAKESINEGLQVMEALLRDYSSIWIVNSKTAFLRLFSFNEDIVTNTALNQATDISNYQEVLKVLVERYVVEKEREKLLKEISLENIEKKLQDSYIYNAKYTQIDENGKESFHLIVYVKINEDSFILAFKDVDKIVKTEIKNASRKAKLQQYESDLSSMELIHAALGSGSWSMEFDENGQLSKCFWSDTFRNMLGFNDEKDFPNILESWSDLLYGEDREKTLAAYWNTVNDYSGKTTFDEKYRLYTKNAGIRWFHALGRLSRRADGTPVKFVGLFIDVTDEIETTEREKEQNEIVQALSRGFINIFSIDMKTRSAQVIKMDGYVPSGVPNAAPNQNYPYDAIVRRYISERVYKDDIEDLTHAMSLENVQKKLTDNNEFVYTYRVLDEDEIHYFQFKYIRLDPNDKESKVIVAFKNIDEVIRQEREKESLLYLSQTDQMTKLLNRTCGQEKITKLLTEKRGGIFFILDIDHFKHFNDTYGHKTGDDVIISFANTIKETFRDQDIIFRLGGDEFAVFVPNITNEDLALVVINRFINKLKEIKIKSAKSESVFASIGAGIIPEGFKINFEKLYRLVDTGVYKSKNVKGQSSVTFVELR